MSDLINKLVTRNTNHGKHNQIPSLCAATSPGQPQLTYLRSIIGMIFLITLGTTTSLYLYWQYNLSPTTQEVPLTVTNQAPSDLVKTPMVAHTNQASSDLLVKTPMVVAHTNQASSDLVAHTNQDTTDLVAHTNQDTTDLIEAPLIAHTNQEHTDAIDDMLDDQFTDDIILSNSNHVDSNVLISKPQPTTLKIAPPPPNVQQATNGTITRIQNDSLDNLYNQIIHDQLYPAIVTIYQFPKEQKGELIHLIKQLVIRLNKVNHLAESGTVADAALALYPTNTTLIKLKAMVLVSQKQFDEARQLLHNFTPSFDEHLSYYNLLAYSELSTAHYPEAIQIYKQLVDIKPQKTNYWVSLAMTYEKNKNLRSAFEAYRHAMKLMRPTSLNYEFVRDKQSQLKHSLKL